MDLRTTTTHVGGVHVLALEGVADLAAAPALHRALARCGPEPGGDTVAVDVDGLTVLDDVAVGLLLGAAARLRAAGAELVVVCSTPRIASRLEALRVDRIVRISPSIAATHGRTTR